VGGTPSPLANNMPQTLAYRFTPPDLALIAQWIGNGSPDN
jgi:hypothetical protein